MNKFFYIICILSSFFISSCGINKKNINNTSLIIEEFNLSHYSKNGSKQYTLSTPYSVFNQTIQTYLLNKTNIKFFENENIKYDVNSDSSKLLNNKFLELKGNVEIKDFNSNRTIIKSNKLFWNIDNSQFVLEGNVTLVNNNINLNSSKALLDKKTDMIEFFNPVKYSYSGGQSVKNYNISSENAYYDISTKAVTFKSKNNKVKSKIVF